MKKFLVIIFLTLFSFTQGKAQLDNVAGSVKESLIGVGITYESIFNLDDFYLGFGVGAEDIGLKWGSKLQFNFRPSYKKVLIEGSNDEVYQYREKKFFISLDFDKRLFDLPLSEITHIHGFGLLKLGFLFGDYRGTKNRPEAGFMASPVTGVAFAFDNTFFIRIGYNWLEDHLETVPNGRIYIGLTAAIH